MTPDDKIPQNFRGIGSAQSDEKWKAKGKKVDRAEEKEIKKLFLPGDRLGVPAQLERHLKELGFGIIIKREDGILFKIVESEDIHKKPCLYVQFLFKNDGIELEYSLTRDVSKKKRELDVATLLLEMLVSSSEYIIDFKSLYPYMLGVLSSATEFVEPNYESLKAKHDSLLDDMKGKEARYREAMLVMDKNNKLIIETEKQNELLRERVKKLEGIDDDVLYEELTRWIKAHGGNINIVDFANSYSVTPARVKIGLDHLSRSGYLKRVN